MFRSIRTALIVFGFLASFAEGQEPVPLDGNAVPEYPEEARFALITGDVWFRAWVTEEGTVQSVEITRVPAQDKGFEGVVVSTVGKWRFEPAKNGSVPKASWFEGFVRFSLKPEDEESIHELTERATLAWNRNEPRVLASLFTDEAHMHTVTEDPARGPYQIRERFNSLLSATLRGADLVLGVDMIRFFATDRAEVEHTYQLTGAIENIGRLATTLTSVDGVWLIDHARLIEQASMLWDIDPVIEFNPPQPATPPEASANQISGRVLLDILVRRDGTTEVVKVVEGLPHGCTEAAVDHARQWRWKPARRGGEPVEATGTIWVDFGEEK